MPRYRADEHLPYFCTITILDWLPVLIDARYIDPVVDSLRFCRRNKALKLFGFVVMPNHVHLIASCGEQLQELMRDFKRFTSRQIHERLKADGRTTLLHWLEHATQEARRAHGELGLWQDGFHPQAIWSRDVFQQKLDYLHANPCRKGLVQRPEQWWYSSAAFHAGEQAFCLEMDVAEF
jgi:REP element-mobilizing transposase RayT